MESLGACQPMLPFFVSCLDVPSSYACTIVVSVIPDDLIIFSDVMPPHAQPHATTSAFSVFQCLGAVLGATTVHADAASL